MPRARRDAVIGLARALAQGELVIDAGAERDETIRRLRAMPGIGPWTTAYVAMRALGDPDAFMPNDLGVLHALEELGEDPSPAATLRLGERWRPYRAYALQYLWARVATAPRVPPQALAPPSRLTPTNEASIWPR